MKKATRRSLVSPMNRGGCHALSRAVEEAVPTNVERNKRSLITGPFPVRSSRRTYAVAGTGRLPA